MEGIILMKTTIEVILICAGATLVIIELAAAIAIKNVHDYMVDRMDKIL